MTKVHYVTGPSPISVLTCPDTPELGLPSIHSYSYEFQSSPAFNRICPALESGILVKYSGQPEFQAIIEYIIIKRQLIGTG